jgi:hypothetical protein
MPTSASTAPAVPSGAGWPPWCATWRRLPRTSTWMNPRSRRHARSSPSRFPRRPLTRLRLGGLGGGRGWSRTRRAASRRCRGTRSCSRRRRQLTGQRGNGERGGRVVEAEPRLRGPSQRGGRSLPRHDAHRGLSDRAPAPLSPRHVCNGAVWRRPAAGNRGTVRGVDARKQTELPRRGRFVLRQGRRLAMVRAVTLRSTTLPASLWPIVRCVGDVPSRSSRMICAPHAQGVLDA